ncbi:UDP-N-acetylmuramyl-tripeptide synthetase [Synechococcus sp. PCC 7502]|uniref:UDP-N-acetylmuramoyl-L-alanyl-D-glutamate--2, 6-diaminopimelate ligase n=1 Tax=Synechococcus sp. PCC 7502 TaxID=1173263 RepID=UPI00029FC495|nr:UDP-N-acetylmuramoyl-L-alanyl-D-glutamate--2,6-diaminopimelate ligase [Synechococcus sp. PCC 7502]AFY75021.1 UDP-N-acetylmuramyl-tripeptide synthetase [Synechococcus sp. PCC 7502]
MSIQFIDGVPLSELLSGAGYKNQVQNSSYDNDLILRIVTDSRIVQAGDLFIAMIGSKADGSQYVSQALANGAIAAIIDRSSNLEPHPQVIAVPDVITACAEIAASFYDHPVQKLKLVGVTGTNGKTTTTHLIEFLLKDKYATGLMGTLYTRWQGYEHISTHTTPFAVDLQAQFKQAVDQNQEVMVMEVSSHALAQRRVWTCPFGVSVFTNLTQDHLDYHLNLEDYFQAKALLFTPDYLKGKAVINLDDAYGVRLIADCRSRKQPVWTYSLTNSEADFFTDNLTYSSNGVTATLHTPLGAIAFSSPLVGSFNLANVLAAIATAVELGISLREIVERLPKFKSVPGRVEQVQISEDQDITVVVDYAHTPDSLENLLKAMRPFTKRELICVFGCGGDRDRTKRPIMGEIAARLADRVYITSDNPRTENAELILQDILKGVPEQVNAKVEIDRRICIKEAIAKAEAGDTVLIAGKGHEDYQIIGTEKIHFDDREEAKIALQAR